MAYRRRSPVMSAPASTSRARARRTTVSRSGNTRPCSTWPGVARFKPARSATCSWVSPSSLRRARTRAPNSAASSGFLAGFRAIPRPCRHRTNCSTVNSQYHVGRESGRAKRSDLVGVRAALRLALGRGHARTGHLVPVDHQEHLRPGHQHHWVRVLDVVVVPPSSDHRLLRRRARSLLAQVQPLQPYRHPGKRSEPRTTRPRRHHERSSWQHRTSPFSPSVATAASAHTSTSTCGRWD